ncbi:hypothetical protein SLEP1_g9658 [Rubroshorea leprosula]|uniref:Serine-threonine/tyrosine-protein kinase catalytic domain-containing protein n=1 Tax=Rubroshorea leprosula TaxID=152421 RepID=A0AAV5IEV1_9ROSI|nr:hypothetical protein SLEP1_g9658 [Rubroshorea leprosula]
MEYEITLPHLVIIVTNELPASRSSLLSFQFQLPTPARLEAGIYMHNRLGRDGFRPPRSVVREGGHEHKTSLLILKVKHRANKTPNPVRQPNTEGGKQLKTSTVLGREAAETRSNFNGSESEVNLKQKGASKSFMVECEMVRNIQHQNLVKTITICSSIDFQRSDFKALVYKLMKNGSLEEWLRPDEDQACEHSLTSFKDFI